MAPKTSAIVSNVFKTFSHGDVYKNFSWGDTQFSGSNRGRTDFGLWRGDWENCNYWKWEAEINATHSPPPYTTPCTEEALGYGPNTFKADVDRLENDKWIDGLTALVHVTCNFVNYNIDAEATVRYTLEFTSSGRTRPAAPIISVDRNNRENTEWEALFVIYLYGLWTFFGEQLFFIYDETVETMENREGLWKYVPRHPGFGAGRGIVVIDLCIYLACWSCWQAHLSRLWFSPTYVLSLAVFSETDSLIQLQTMLGRILLFSMLRMLFLVDAIPYLNVVGRTLSWSSGPIAMFFIVFAVMMVGFTFNFFMVFTSQIPAFETLSGSFFAIFRGMLGDMPLDEMYFMSPAATGLLYMSFVMIMLNTVFTILIAIISDTYTDVTEDWDSQTLHEGDRGAAAILTRGLLGACGLYTPVPGPPAGSGQP